MINCYYIECENMNHKNSPSYNELAMNKLILR